MKMCSIPNNMYGICFAVSSIAYSSAHQRNNFSRKECIRNSAFCTSKITESNKSIRSTWRWLLLLFLRFFFWKCRGRKVVGEFGCVYTVCWLPFLLLLYIKSNFVNLDCARTNRSQWKIATKFFIRSLANSAIYSFCRHFVHRSNKLI